MLLPVMTMLAQVAVAGLPLTNSQPKVCWFWPRGCVVEGGGVKQVFVGGALIGRFDPNGRDRGPRNVLLVTLAKEPSMHLGHLAAAFGIGEEYLRRLRRLEETQGLRAVLKLATGCGERSRVPNEMKRRELHALFEEGWNASDATRRQRRGKRVSRPTVSRERRRWHAEKESAVIAARATAAIELAQLTLLSSVGNSTSTGATTEVAGPVAAVAAPTPIEEVADPAAAPAPDGSSMEAATPTDIVEPAPDTHAADEPGSTEAPACFGPWRSPKTEHGDRRKRSMAITENGHGDRRSDQSPRAMAIA